MTEEKIAKINYYAKKEREEGLTCEEKQEQMKLRQEYLDSFKKNLRTRIENMVFVDPLGNETTIRKKRQ